MKFSGIVHAWKYMSNRNKTPVGKDEVKLLVITSKSPAAYYDPRFGFDCFQLIISMRPSADLLIHPGHILHVEGVLRSFNSKYGNMGDKWVTSLECRLDDVKIIGMNPMTFDPSEHLLATQTNSKGMV